MKPLNSKNFEQQIDRWVESEAKRANDFCDLVRELKGVFPTEVVDAIKRLVEQNDKFSELLPDECFEIKRPVIDWLPIPHPLDSDWRFTSSTRNWLVERIGQNGQECSIALLGTPSLIPDVIEEGICNHVHLFDVNPNVITAVNRRFPAVKTCLIDLTTKVPPLQDFDVVVLDPPWYPKHWDSFLHAASNLCRKGGEVLASFPSVGTRDGVSSQFDEFLATADSVSLGKMETIPFGLRYESPFFEQCALAASGLGNCPLDWRTGDFVGFTRSQGETKKCFVPPAPSVVKWQEIRLNGVRVKVRQKANESGSPAVRSIVAKDVLKTVSQRSPVVAEADIWTSDNRVFGCENTSVLLRLFQYWEDTHYRSDIGSLGCVETEVLNWFDGLAHIVNSVKKC